MLSLCLILLLLSLNASSVLLKKINLDNYFFPITGDSDISLDRLAFSDSSTYLGFAGDKQLIISGYNCFFSLDAAKSSYYSYFIFRFSVPYNASCFAGTNIYGVNIIAASRLIDPTLVFSRDYI